MVKVSRFVAPKITRFYMCRKAGGNQVRPGHACGLRNCTTHLQFVFRVQSVSAFHLYTAYASLERPVRTGCCAVGQFCLWHCPCLCNRIPYSATFFGNLQIGPSRYAGCIVICPASGEANMRVGIYEPRNDCLLTYDLLNVKLGVLSVKGIEIPCIDTTTIVDNQASRGNYFQLFVGKGAIRG